MEDNICLKRASWPYLCFPQNFGLSSIFFLFNFQIVFIALKHRNSLMVEYPALTPLLGFHAPLAAHSLSVQVVSCHPCVCRRFSPLRVQLKKPVCCFHLKLEFNSSMQQSFSLRVPTGKVIPIPCPEKVGINQTIPFAFNVMLYYRPTWPTKRGHHPHFA